MRYEILKADSAEELEKKVNQALLHGATLVGGLAIASDGYIGMSLIYRQAILWK